MVIRAINLRRGMGVTHEGKLCVVFSNDHVQKGKGSSHMQTELRDVETLRIALRAADTGHLVFAAVHASDARQTVERIIAMFDPAEHELLLTQLSMNIQAVISLRLARATRRLGGGLLPRARACSSSQNM